MKAVVFAKAGRPEEVLTVGTAPDPQPAADQVLIQVSARSIQPADFLFVEGRYRYAPQLPQVAGFDGAGTVVAVGSAVKDIQPGTRVAFRGVGAWAEMAVAPRARVYPVPAGISDDLASQFALNPLTAWGLLAECRLVAGSRLLITAGHSVVARLLVALANQQGIDATILVRDGGGYAIRKGLNGEVLGRAATVADALAPIIAEAPFHAVVDAVGGADSLALIDGIEPGGRLITYGLLNDTDITFKASTLLRRNLTWQGFGIDHWIQITPIADLDVAAKTLWRLLAEQPDLLPVIAHYPLERIADAIDAVRQANQPGKVILTT